MGDQRAQTGANRAKRYGQVKEARLPEVEEEEVRGDGKREGYVIIYSSIPNTISLLFIRRLS
jgi:hypothetical protein